MDKLKVSIDLMNAEKALDELNKAIAAYDYHQIGIQQVNLKYALRNLRIDLGMPKLLDQDKPQDNQP